MNKKKIFPERVHTCPLEAIREAVYKPHALEACAAATGVTTKTLSMQLNDEGSHLSVLRSAAIEKFLDTDVLAECHAARRGGIFIKLPASIDDGVEELRTEFSVFIKEFGETSLAFSEMVADGKIEAHEVDRFEREAREMWAQTERMIRLSRLKIVADR